MSKQSTVVKRECRVVENHMNIDIKRYSRCINRRTGARNFGYVGHRRNLGGQFYAAPCEVENHASSISVDGVLLSVAVAS